MRLSDSDGAGILGDGERGLKRFEGGVERRRLIVHSVSMRRRRRMRIWASKGEGEDYLTIR